MRLYSQSDENAAEVRKKLYQIGINEGRWGKIGLGKAEIPSHKTIISINEHFDETGCVDVVFSQKNTQNREKSEEEDLLSGLLDPPI